MNTMKNAVQEFVKNFSFSGEYRFLESHYQKDSEQSHLIRDFLSDSGILFDIDMDAQISQEVIDQIQDCDAFGDFIDGSIDMYNSDLIASIELFWEWIEDFGNKDNFYKNIAMGQYIAYTESLSELQNKFVEYLEAKI